MKGGEHIDSVEKVSVNEVDVAFLYLENDSFTVMNNQTSNK